MAKTLLIYAHPNTEGHCKILKNEVEKLLQDHNEEYELIDLYAIKYDPILHEREHYTAGGRSVSVENKRFQQKITDANRLIFIYPIWWNSMPAVLKGWLDRVLTSHFAFRFSVRKFLGMELAVPVKLLTGRKALLFITGGTPRPLAWIFLRDRASKIMGKDTLGYCGIKTRTVQFGGCTKLDEKKEKELRRGVKNNLPKFMGW